MTPQEALRRESAQQGTECILLDEHRFPDDVLVIVYDQLPRDTGDLWERWITRRMAGYKGEKAMFGAVIDSRPAE